MAGTEFAMVKALPQVSYLPTTDISRLPFPLFLLTFFIIVLTTVVSTQSLKKHCGKWPCLDLLLAFLAS